MDGDPMPEEYNVLLALYHKLQARNRVLQEENTNLKNQVVALGRKLIDATDKQQ